jgi:hypothetical protein
LKTSATRVIARSIEFAQLGGTCPHRAVTSQQALTLLGIPSRIMYGAVLYRAGSHARAGRSTGAGRLNTFRNCIS